MYELAKKLFPICRSITGDGVRKTLSILREIVPEMQIYEIPSGTTAFDWSVPKEWNIRDAYIEDSKGNKIIDFSQNNLHVVGYSLPLNEYMNLEQLKRIIFTQPNQPNEIPYITSYYTERSGFCMSENLKNTLKEDIYHCVIDSELRDGSLTYGELIIPGETSEEVLLSTYICHPSMANNEISGPVVTINLAKWLLGLARRKYTYRILFLPETIGAITYLSKNLDVMKRNTIAGFVLSCVGDDRTYSYVETRYADTLTDKLLGHVLKYYYPDFKKYSFLQRGSDERQYNAPGVDLPVCSVCRSKYEEYEEYHTSADNLNVISERGLQGSFELMKKCIRILEWNEFYQVVNLCEPQLGKRGLHSTLSQKGNNSKNTKTIMNFLAYADGKNDLIDIANIIKIPAEELISILKVLLEKGLIEIKREESMDDI